ncbi:MAG: glycyl-radical enzyme activating protein [Desulfocucumaceae bacterium]
MEKKPLILEIKGNSLDDGPGIRTVIFCKGCPLSCLWCHNPESKRTWPEISFDPELCVGCKTCIETCASQAVSFDNPFLVDRSRCSLCHACTDNCPSGALSRVGIEMTAGQIVEKVMKDKPFFDASHGGVTLSGGEPTMYMEFVSGLLKEFKGAGVHTLLETCGQFDWNNFKEYILPYADMIFIDIKLFDTALHKQYCGVGNELILSNFIKLNQMATEGALQLTPRIPLIPYITATEKNLREIAKFLIENEAFRVQLLPNNPLWHQKCKKLGLESPLQGRDYLQKWLPREEVQKCEEIIKEFGISLV